MSKTTKKRFVTKRLALEFVLPKEDELIGQVIGSVGRDLLDVRDQNDERYLASMPPRFRNTVYVRRGQFVYLLPIAEGDKVKAEITHVLDTETLLHVRERGLWPKRFEDEAMAMTRDAKRDHIESSNAIDVDLLPPSDSSEDETDESEEEEEDESSDVEPLKIVEMGNGNSLMLQDEEITEIAQETGFSKNQIVRLYSRFLNLDRQGRGYLDREDFLRIPELAINPLGDRIVDAFFTESVNHSNSTQRLYSEYDDNRINFRQFVRVLAHFRPTDKTKPDGINSRENKLRFAFSMYDLNKNNYITREEFKFILNMMVGKNITSEQLDSIADRTISEADLDQDEKISFEEFCKAMQRTDIEQKMSIRFLN
ncbi:putative translation initiation factor eIF-1A [Aphelenchoides besseyi]|nr:putative translation initiation factor eIF-1A [Aphelenchoides besseyi]